MSLATRIQDLAIRIATEFKTVKTIISGDVSGSLAGLTTTVKTSIIAAINELKTRIDGKEGTITKGDLKAKANETELTGSGVGSLIGADVTVGLATSVKTDIAKGVAADAYRLIGHIPLSQKGVASGVATLDAGGLVPSTQLPSYVDDVIEVANLTALNALPPGDKMAGKIYVTIDNNKTYRWTGTVFVYITSGAVDSVNGKTGVVVLAKVDIGLGSVDNTTDAAKPISTAQAAVNALKANASDVYTKTEIGNPETDFVAIFEANLI